MSSRVMMTKLPFMKFFNTWIYGKSLSEKVPSIKEITFDSFTASAKG